MKYVILEFPSSAELQKWVNEYLEAAWEPQGGVAVVATPTGNAWAQALVQKEQK